MLKLNHILNVIRRKAGLVFDFIKFKASLIVDFFKRNTVLILNWLLPGCDFKAFFISSLHAVWMIMFSLLWLGHINMFDGFDFMRDFMGYRDLLTKKILNIQSGSDITTKYLLINTSNNNQLLALDNDNQINTVITDRNELVRVLNILNDNLDKVKYIICDVFFGEPDSINDNALSEIITLLDQKKKIIIPYYIIEGENYIHYPIFEANHGLSQYRFSFLNTQYLKFSFISYDTIKHMPLVVYEDITGKKMNNRKLLGINYYILNNKWCLNTIIPEFRYTSSNLHPDSTFFDLGFFTADLIGKNQIVFIGDFEGTRDRHHSIITQVAGPLIVINAYESLVHGDNLIKIPYLLLLFFFFTVISYLTFYRTPLKPYLSKKGKPRIIINFLRSNINYLLILILTLISMLFFHHYIHLLILLSYFAFIEIVIAFLKRLTKHKKVING